MNALLAIARTQGAQLPDFSAITPELVEPTLDQLIGDTGAAFAQHEQQIQPTWASAMEQIHAITEPVGLAWGVVTHLHSVRNTPELRAVYQRVQPKIVTLWTTIGQSTALYQAVRALRASPAWPSLSAAQQRAIEIQIRDMERTGVALAGPARERFQAISIELSGLGTAFSNHVMDATKAFALDLSDPAEVDGLPPSALAQAAAAATAAGRQGWRITLDAPSYGPFMEHSRRRDLRERLYRAFITRASSGDADNQPLIANILALRQEIATLLGKASYAEVSVSSKMAGTVAAVEGLLHQLHRVAKPKADAELAELTAFAREQSGDRTLILQLWDVAFWAERLRERKYSYTDEQLRPYFALPQVLDGLFALASRLFEVQIAVDPTAASTWHPDVRLYRIRNAEGVDIAAFWLDPYSRPADKKGGAWMDSYRGRLPQSTGLRTPVAYLVCNQTPPVGDTPSLMTFREVETLFHEFGHGIQHLLTRIDVPQVAGIEGVEWDAVELPSQFMENWCYDAATVLGSGQPGSVGLARHWQTGEALPRELFERICAGRTYRAASMTLRQVLFATVDIEVHHRLSAGGTAQQVFERLARTHTTLAPLAEDRFLCSFGHIFAGGYAAGYYSYKWAEVLSADAFAAFTEAGPAQHAAIGRRFRDTVLALGGSRHPSEVFRQFRGRDPSVEPLLKQGGMAG